MRMRRHTTMALEKDHIYDKDFFAAIDGGERVPITSANFRGWIFNQHNS